MWESCCRPIQLRSMPRDTDAHHANALQDHPNRYLLLEMRCGPFPPTAQTQIPPFGPFAGVGRTGCVRESSRETSRPVAVQTVPRIWHAVDARKKLANAPLGSQSLRHARTTLRLVDRPPWPVWCTDRDATLRRLEGPSPHVGHATSGEEPATKICPKPNEPTFLQQFGPTRHSTWRTAPGPPTPCAIGPELGHEHPRPAPGGSARVRPSCRLGPKCLERSPSVRPQPPTREAAKPEPPSHRQIR